MQAEQKKTRYTYADYAQWPDGERWELIEGIPYALAPGPSSEHQSASVEISRQIANYLIGKTCRVFTAPYDVILSDTNVVEPDIVVVCDRAKIERKGCVGTPDMIVEILSPSSVGHDRTEKF